MKSFLGWELIKKSDKHEEVESEYNLQISSAHVKNETQL